MSTRSTVTHQEETPASIVWAQMPEWDQDPAESARLLRAKASAFHRLNVGDQERRELYKAAGFRLAREIDLANAALFEARKSWLRNMRQAPPDLTGALWILEERELVTLADSMTIQELATIRDKCRSRGWTLSHFLFECGIRSGRAESPYPPGDPVEYFRSQTTLLQNRFTLERALEAQ